VLLGIKAVTLVSESWGGHVSNKYLTEHCAILRKLLAGDVILADSGFVFSELIGASLHIPAFIKGKDQLSAIEIKETRTIANVQIHVERVN